MARFIVAALMVGSIFIALTINPLFFVATIGLGVLLGGMSPADLRSDGKRKSGGILGSLIDRVEIDATMKDCPYCGSKVFKKAVKCQHCHEDLRIKFHLSGVSM